MRLLAVLALFPLMAHGEGPAAPNTLSKERITEGWISLFDGETTFGWTTEGAVTVEKGVLKIGGDQVSSVLWNHPTIPGELRYSELLEGEWKAKKMTFENGKNPLKVGVAPGKKSEFRDIHFKPAAMKDLFNGKDLTGWKENAAKKASVFSVTKEGWLNVKNGPGDLQTTDQWADFLLQLECISNGKHLNSGIFFRAIPDQYQQGYEAQIRNEWIGEDRTKPFDFGTGAIYRRVPARKVVSTDGEWFTMTVLAKGKRLSTWVNGYPVVDWLDDRKEADNGRNGAKTSKGAISIQGHDPTTDLSFRNIRILSLD
ncbi:3-keto-disaccharide hydrolase [Zavarzinella formosa]|uniref:3-keto-disaccharide hydrolase n=1 Tax=Zavarzinella formosa TaxID=360055 RepID=UPI0002E781E8|nr:DUF1080 domain-containing protein [Zavarzinella formosa]